MNILIDDEITMGSITLGDIHRDVLNNVLFPMLHAEDHRALLNLTLVNKHLNAHVNQYLQSLRNKYSHAPTHQEIRVVTKQRLTLIVNMWLQKYDVSPFMMRHVYKHGLDHNISIEFIKKLSEQSIRFGILGAMSNKNLEHAYKSIEMLSSIGSEYADYLKKMIVNDGVRKNIQLAKKLAIEYIKRKKKFEALCFAKKIAANPYFNGDMDFIQMLVDIVSQHEHTIKSQSKFVLFIAVSGNGDIRIFNELFPQMRTQLYVSELAYAYNSACAGGQLEIVKILKSKVLLLSEFDDTAFLQACQYNQMNVVNYLRSQGITPKSYDVNRHFCNVCVYDNTELLEFMLPFMDKKSVSYINHVCTHNSPNVLKKLIEHGFKCDPAVLQAAYRKNYPAIIDVLKPILSYDMSYALLGACERGDTSTIINLINTNDITFRSQDEKNDHIKSIHDSSPVATSSEKHNDWRVPFSTVLLTAHRACEPVVVDILIERYRESINLSKCMRNISSKIRAILREHGVHDVAN